MPRRTSVTARAGSALGSVVLLAGVLSSCSSTTPGDAPTPEPTPLASYDGTVVQVERVSFCSRIPEDAVRDAVGAEVTTAHYGNGEPLPGTDDLAHEYGCVFTGEDRTVARTWVFVPPVTPRRARQLAATAAKMPRCASTPAATFGKPAVGTVCRGSGSTTVTYRGLFGDAWLSCSVTAPRTGEAAADKTLVAKAGVWCVRVAEAASA